MAFSLLLSAALASAGLAYDAWNRATRAKNVPCSVAAKGLGQDVSGTPLHEQNKRKDWNARYGTGDLSQPVWLWGILALACATGAAAGLLG